ncbi:MAG: hypothetical protein V5A79_07570 [Candidatus Bipolaricaulota bacterium]
MAEARSKEEKVDKSTALRQLMYEGAEQYVLELISEGRLSVSRGAEILNQSVHEIYRLAKKKNVEIGATEEQYEKGKETGEKTIS